jgi:hypothetical protein
MKIPPGHFMKIPPEHFMKIPPEHFMKIPPEHFMKIPPEHFSCPLISTNGYIWLLFAVGTCLAKKKRQLRAQKGVIRIRLQHKTL